MEGIMHNANSGHDQTMGGVEWLTLPVPQTKLTSDYARLYREAQEASRLKDEFLMLVAHELRTPLAAVLGWTQILRSKKHDEATASRAMGRHRTQRSGIGATDRRLDGSGARHLT